MVEYRWKLDRETLRSHTKYPVVHWSDVGFIPSCSEMRAVGMTLVVNHVKGSSAPDYTLLHVADSIRRTLRAPWHTHHFTLCQFKDNQFVTRLNTDTSQKEHVWALHPDTGKPITEQDFLEFLEHTDGAMDREALLMSPVDWLQKHPSWPLKEQSWPTDFFSDYFGLQPSETLRSLPAHDQRVNLSYAFTASASSFHVPTQQPKHTPFHQNLFTQTQVQQFQLEASGLYMVSRLSALTEWREDTPWPMARFLQHCMRNIPITFWLSHLPPQKGFDRIDFKVHCRHHTPGHAGTHHCVFYVKTEPEKRAHSLTVSDLNMEHYMKDSLFLNSCSTYLPVHRPQGATVHRSLKTALTAHTKIVRTIEQAAQKHMTQERHVAFIQRGQQLSRQLDDAYTLMFEQKESQAYSLFLTVHPQVREYLRDAQLQQLLTEAELQGCEKARHKVSLQTLERQLEPYYAPAAASTRPRLWRDFTWEVTLYLVLWTCLLVAEILLLVHWFRKPS